MRGAGPTIQQARGVMNEKSKLEHERNFRREGQLAKETYAGRGRESREGSPCPSTIVLLSLGVCLN